ncbi:hypothetical protein [Nonomuraea wenchangensis]|uniref:Uncharacterized protein n=1 Tax=Nonomuraea wenchangensis TaxID=568860 RepID=A0A1I0ACV8_9ACTN|nr:hypothetical protein [Nonomuraea wenchangensis]SES91597.1 hypothetical protein SAMN05421811_101738 [Nonomuraea wenchangensis]
MGALIAALSVAFGAIAALVSWLILNALGADGVTIFTVSGAALLGVPTLVIGLVAFARSFGKERKP